MNAKIGIITVLFNPYLPKILIRTRRRDKLSLRLSFFAPLQQVARVSPFLYCQLAAPCIKPKNGTLRQYPPAGSAVRTDFLSPPNTQKKRGRPPPTGDGPPVVMTVRRKIRSFIPVLFPIPVFAVEKAPKTSVLGAFCR